MTFFCCVEEVLGGFEKAGGYMQNNILLEHGFGRLPKDLITAYMAAHLEISKKYNNVVPLEGKWGGVYSKKHDGMHISLTDKFAKILTNK